MSGRTNDIYWLDKAGNALTAFRMDWDLRQPTMRIEWEGQANWVTGTVQVLRAQRIASVKDWHLSVLVDHR